MLKSALRLSLNVAKQGEEPHLAARTNVSHACRTPCVRRGGPGWAQSPNLCPNLTEAPVIQRNPDADADLDRMDETALSH